jgi:CBS domain-containing protein
MGPMSDSNASDKSAERSDAISVQRSIVPPELAPLGEHLALGEHVPLTVRRLLALFDETRRSPSAIERIARTMRDHAISCTPNFADAWIDETVTLRLPTAETAREDVTPTQSVVAPPAEPGLTSEPEATSMVQPGNSAHVVEPANRVGAIAAAHRPLVSLSPDEPIIEAVSIMQLRGVVMVSVTERGDRKLLGIVTWRSIAVALLDRASPTLRQCLEPARECPLEADLFEVARMVRTDGPVFVRGADGVLCGPVTQEDLVAEFGPRLEPFLLAGEVELALRSLVQERFPEEARSTCDARGTPAQRGLTLGECQRILQDPRCFDCAGIPFSRRQFDARLEDVRLLRNDLMHFNGGEPIDPQRVDELRHFVRALRRVIGARC